jgi:hypothetical protein
MNSAEDALDPETMRLDGHAVAGWPKLAWVAKCTARSPRISVLHGPCVEVNPRWAVEAVWAGRFADGDFDQTDLVFGSGIRVRGQHVVFVPSAATTDRLWHYQRDGSFYVANSLPAILAVTGTHLLMDHHYFTDIRTITGGLSAYRRSIPIDSGELGVQYFHNLQFDGTTIREIEKPDSAPTIGTYSEYRDFLVGTAKALKENLDDGNRQHRVDSLTSISSGYDAGATAVIAREAGCRRAVTIRQSASHWRGSDSGKAVAKHLGLACREYDLRAESYPHEAAVWSVSGRAAILNWTTFDYPQPLCLFFSGCRGDMVWDRDTCDPPKPFSVPSVSDMGICEFRLFRGVFHCVVPAWGVRHIGEIRAIAHHEEMKPWSVGGKYDRPVARRLIEEAGVPRGAFAVQKKNASTEEYFLWPYSKEARESFGQFLREHGVYVPPGSLVGLLRQIVNTDRLIYLNLTSKLGLWDPALRIRWRLRANRLLFHWANHVLRAQYAQAFDEHEAACDDAANEPTDFAATTRGVTR